MSTYIEDGKTYETKIIDPKDYLDYAIRGWTQIKDSRRGPGVVDDDPRYLWHDQRIVIRREVK